MDVIDVRPLEIMEGGALEPGDGRGAAVDERPARPSRTATQALSLSRKVQPSTARAKALRAMRRPSRAARRSRTTDVAMNPRPLPAFAEFLEPAHDAVIRERLDLGLGARARRRRCRRIPAGSRR